MPNLDLISNLSSPVFDAPPDVQADWLELAAFLSASGRSRLDDLIGQQDLEWNQEPADFGETDEVLTDIVANVVAEVERRAHDLEGAYPFSMTEDGSSLVLTKEWSLGNAVYLFCLIIAHAVRSELVSLELAPDDASLRAAWDIFQVCATLAAAGRCDGPSYSIGWPRPDKTGFLEKLKQVWAHFGDGKPREVPLPGTPNQIKDEGVDVIAWWPERDEQPGQGFLIGQVASGHDWKDKSIRPHLERFLNEWFCVQPVSLAPPNSFYPVHGTPRSDATDILDARLRHSQGQTSAVCCPRSCISGARDSSYRADRRATIYRRLAARSFSRIETEGECVRHRFHALCPYFAMFPEMLVRKHLVWSKRGDLILDPFSGRGTTVFESLLNDRRAIACDTNPVAVCVSRAKSAAPTMGKHWTAC